MVEKKYRVQYVSVGSIVTETEPFLEEYRADALRSFFVAVQSEMDGLPEDLYRTATMCFYEESQLIATIHLAEKTT